jgi:hypothetical protein
LAKRFGFTTDLSWLAGSLGRFFGSSFLLLVFVLHFCHNFIFEMSQAPLDFCDKFIADLIIKRWDWTLLNGIASEHIFEWRVSCFERL